MFYFRPDGNDGLISCVEQEMGGDAGGSYPTGKETVRVRYSIYGAEQLIKNIQECIQELKEDKISKEE